MESKGSELVATRWQGNLMSGDSRVKGMRQIHTSPIAANYWTLQERLAEDCAIAKEDDYVFFVGGLPPGHFDLRRRMKE